METLNAILKILSPLIEMLALVVGPPIITYIAAKLIQFTGLKNEEKKNEVEAQLRTALHQSIENGLLFGMARMGLNPASIPILIKQAASIEDETVGAAARNTLRSLIRVATDEYVAKKNPETIDKLKATPQAIGDIALAKLQMVNEQG